MILATRVQTLNERSLRHDGRYVLYWMQQSQRTRGNHALEIAIEQANTLHLPLRVVFGVTDNYPEANLRHYAFMLQGLADVAKKLNKRGIEFILDRGDPPAVALKHCRHAAMVVCDRGYLRHQKQWRRTVASRARCRVIQVESDVVVPVDVVSNKAEFAARTIRPKIQQHVDAYVKPLPETKVLCRSGQAHVVNEHKWLRSLRIDRSVGVVTNRRGGEVEAYRLLREFVRHKLAGYASNRNEPAANATSMLSAYLHFGQISVVDIARAVRESDAPKIDRDAFLEELIVRRELAANHVYFQAKYDSFASLPAWARQTLRAHCKDARPLVYSRRQLEQAETHDRFWNAAQLQMIRSGCMHNHMRMYWGKKILEWSRTPERAFATTLYLNNKYSIDGRDPNAYANVAWIFGLHDRPWTRRPIFGTVRYMNAAGLVRKFDMEGYVRYVDSLK